MWFSVVHSKPQNLFNSYLYYYTLCVLPLSGNSKGGPPQQDGPSAMFPMETSYLILLLVCWGGGRLFFFFPNTKAMYTASIF